MKAYIANDIHSIERQIVNHIEYTVAKCRFAFTNFHAFQATAYSVRDRLIERLNDTNAEVTVSLLLLSNLFQAHRKKKVHFLSGEFMIGRLLQLNLINIGLEDEFKEALNNLGVNLNDLYTQESE